MGGSGGAVQGQKLLGARMHGVHMELAVAVTQPLITTVPIAMASSSKVDATG
jgi:hypothetical protein